MLNFIPVSFFIVLFSQKGFGFGIKIGFGLWFGFGIGNLIGGAAGTVVGIGRKTPV